jgi:flavin reductase (DIM6/NTAB) family NADH-FMN oxidoreductase RutF
LINPYLQQSVVESAVGLVVVETPSRRNAMTVSFFSEVAHYPASMWVSIARDSLTYSLLEEVGHFAFILLHQGQDALALSCGTCSGRERDKCAGLELYRFAERFLFLRDALTSTACRVRKLQDLGDHSLFIADILAGHVETRNTFARPLLLSDLS